MAKYIDAELLREEIERRRLHFNKEAKKYQALNNGYSQNCYGARDALRDIENFLDTIEEKKIEPLERPYQDADSGLVLDIPQLVDKINEIIEYINGKE